MHVGDFRQGRGAVPLVDRQGQGSADPHVVERLLLVIRRDHVHAVPVAGLDGDLVAEFLHQLIACRRRQPAKLHRRSVGANGIDADRLLVGENAGEPIEIGQALVVVVGVALALDRLTDLILDELERSRSHHVLFVPVRIAIEDFLLVDIGERIGQRGQEGAGREFQVEHHGCRVRCLDAIDHHEIALPRTGDTRPGMHDLLPACRDVVRGQRRPVVPFHAVTDAECLGLAVVGRLRHLGAQVAHEVGRRRRVRRD